MNIEHEKILLEMRSLNKTIIEYPGDYDVERYTIPQLEITQLESKVHESEIVINKYREELGIALNEIKELNTKIEFLEEKYLKLKEQNGKRKN